MGGDNDRTASGWKKLSDMTASEIQIYRALAPVEYEKRLRIADANQQAQRDYGKWLLSSLLAMNGGAIIGTAAAGEIAKDLFVASVPFFVLGIITAMISGLLTWMNWDRATDLYRDMASPNMLFGPDWEPMPLPKTNKYLERTRFFGIAIGIASAVLLIVGILAVWSNLALGFSFF
jgi:hypothetical protein